MKKLFLILLFSACCPTGTHQTQDPKFFVGYCDFCAPNYTDAGPEPDGGVECSVMKNGNLVECDFYD